MTDSKLVIWLAILSRVLIIILQSFSNLFFPDHDAKVFVSPLTPPLNGSSTCHSIIDTIFGGFRRWDAEYFLHIAEHGYTYENTLVFYPLFPFCVRYITNIAHTILGIECEFRDLSLVVAVVLNVIFFVKAALVLHQLTIETFNNYRLARIVATLFCINPASIFFSAPYTESLFCWLSFSVMLHCARNEIRDAILPLALSLWCRSNGLLNFGFILYYVTRDIWSKGTTNWIHFLKGFFKVLSCAIVAGIAFVIVQAYYFSLYCEGNPLEMNEAVLNYGNKNNFLLAGHQKPQWCSFAVPFSYSYLQAYYWNVGFLKYYEFKQIPNFLLAAPILVMIISDAVRFLIENPIIAMRLGLIHTKENAEKSSQFVYVIHALVLSIFCLLFVHIQVSTRMLASSSPYIYWICAQHFQKEHHQNSFKAFLQPKSHSTKFIKAWFLGYFVIGTVLFSNFLPWT
ncbi:GPI mannosyltransferase 2-like [Sitodiplosis mosellana]|uniref:GPI mannosyltransferase 2-like n=1 Tax=Sitodiplosis mosellana TaxID=263140 RepID=UPI002443A793|nr:GPI mannosyltransferase 2-like [Sitodiplosis mosellana]